METTNFIRMEKKKKELYKQVRKKNGKNKMKCHY